MKYQINLLLQCIVFLIYFLSINLNASEPRWIAVGYLNDTLLTLDKTTDFPVYRLSFKDGFMGLSTLNGKLVKIDGRFHKKNSTAVYGKLNIDTIYVDSIRLASSENNLIGYGRFPGCIFPPVKYSLKINEFGMANCQVYDYVGSQMLAGDDTFNVDLFKINSLLRVINENSIHEMLDGGLGLSLCWSGKAIAIGNSLKVQQDDSTWVVFESVVKHFEQYILSRCFPVRIAVGTLEKSNDNKGLILCGNNLWDAYQFTWSAKYDSLIGKRVQIKGLIKQGDLRCLSCPQQLIWVDTIFQVYSTDKPLISYTTLRGVYDMTMVDIYADGRIITRTDLKYEEVLNISLLNRSISAFMNGYFELDSIYDFNLGRYHPVYNSFSFQGKNVETYFSLMPPSLANILKELKSIYTEVNIEQTENNIANVGLLNATPNPFNPVTNISIKQKGLTGKVKVDIFSMQGKKIRTLTANASNNQAMLVWNGCSQNGEKVASGIYLANVFLNGKNRQLKLSLMK
ncbi:MAG: T9SS type A sorting domain-containing protein [Fibrobacteres bacterium]|nr:T9SS type A sorting domain-containing protein [Fibrobacterota bacterium]